MIFTQKKIKVFFLIISIFYITACSDPGVVLNKTALFQDKKMSKKLPVQIKRGEKVQIKDCFSKSCLIEYDKDKKGYLNKNQILKGETKIVTIVEDVVIRKKPDLLSKAIKKIEQGTRGFLIREHKVWSLVNLGKTQGWVLKENIFKGSAPYELLTKQNKLILDCRTNGNWYIPAISKERSYSIEKAFDKNNKTFSLVEHQEEITVIIKNFHSQNEKYVLKYSPPKRFKYKKISLPVDLTVISPFKKNYPLNDSISIPFEGNQIKFTISGKSKNWVYLDNFSIESYKKEL